MKEEEGKGGGRRKKGRKRERIREEGLRKLMLEDPQNGTRIMVGGEGGARRILGTFEA